MPVTYFELTSSRILSLLSLNSYTSIAGAVTPRMLSKQKNSTHNSRQDYFFLKSFHQQNGVYGRLLQVYGNVNCTAWEEVFHSKSSVSILLWRVSLTSVSTQHREYQASIFFLPVGSLFQLTNIVEPWKE